LFQLFGVSEFWARFESAVAGIAIVLLTYAIARRLSGATVGFFAAFVLLTTRHFDSEMRQGTTDAPLCLCIYLAIYCYLRLRNGGASWFYMICAAIGLGAMIKGPAILVVLLAICIDQQLKRSTDSVLGCREYCLGGLLVLAIVAPWHIWMIFRYGRAFLDNYVGYHMVKRATQAIEGNSGGLLYYPSIIGRRAFPWSIVAVGAAWKWMCHREWEHSLLWLLVAVTLIMYSLIPTKLPWYIVPVYPALAIEVGWFLVEVGTNRRIVRYASVAAIALGIIAFSGVVVLQPHSQFANQVAQLAGIAKQCPGAGPLLIIDLESGPKLSTPEAVFYSDRSAILLKLPADANKIMNALKSRAPVDAIIQSKAMDYLSQLCKVHPIAQNDLGTYALISLK
jgi:4-amino-4-deoxy-L-arabinose transferase-like glycosyltransferase